MKWISIGKNNVFERWLDVEVCTICTILRNKCKNRWYISVIWLSILFINELSKYSCNLDFLTINYKLMKQQLPVVSSCSHTCLFFYTKCVSILSSWDHNYKMCKLLQSQPYHILFKNFLHVSFLNNEEWRVIQDYK